MPKPNEKQARKGFVIIKTVEGITKKIYEAYWEEKYTYVHHQTGGHNHWQWIPVCWLTTEEYNNYPGNKA